MLDHKEILKSLVTGENVVSAVTVRETNFGYIIRSEKAGQDAEFRRLIVKFALVAVWIAVGGLWLLPVMGGALKAVVSVVLLAGAFGGLALSQRSGGGCELHVDTSRRELRSATVTPKGESWIRTSARFGEVSTPVLRRGKPENEQRSLCLRIAGEAEEMPVAVGDELTLLAIHDRLMGDLRPMEERSAGFQGNGSETKRENRRVFPRLGPDEVVA